MPTAVCHGMVVLLMPVLQVILSQVYCSGKNMGRWAIKEGNSLNSEAVALCEVHAANGGCAPNVVPLGGIVAKPLGEVNDRICAGPVSALILRPMERSLSDWLMRTDAQLSRAARWTLAKEMIRGLQASQRAGVAHRDFKPDNLLLENGQVYVSDFGLSTCGVTTHTTSIVARGSPPYMAPEVLRCYDAQKRGDAPIAFNMFAADVYSLGVCVLAILHPRLWTAVLAWVAAGGFDECQRHVQRVAEQTFSYDPSMLLLLRRALEPDHVKRAPLEELALIAEAGQAAARAEEAAAALSHAISHGAAALTATPPLAEDAAAWKRDRALADAVAKVRYTSICAVLCDVAQSLCPMLRAAC